MKPTEKKPSGIRLSKLQILIGSFMGWIGLAGFADNVIEWSAWFEYGVIAHWRDFKNWILTDIFFWIPFAIPSYVIDYLAIGGVVGRSLAIGAKRGDNNPKDNPYFLFFVGLVLWNGVLFAFLLGFAKDRSDPDRRIAEHAFKIMGYSIVGLIITVFIASDFRKLLP